MRIFIMALAPLLFAGCAGSDAVPFQSLAPQPVPSPAQVVRACTPQAVLNEGRETRQYPANCPDTLALQDRYALGREIARLEEELREVNYLIASRDGPRLIGGPSRVFNRGFGSTAFLIGRRVDLRNALRQLEAQAARSPEAI